MQTFHWGVQSGFPHIKVLILGIWLMLLGTASVVISVIGIMGTAWGCYVSTGMWGGMTIIVTGLATLYMARVRTSLSAKMYLALSVLDIPISFAMLVLSAGGLTYKSKFYAPVKFDNDTYQVTLFLHGSVLSVSVISLACNILSVIVCLKFITFEKGRHVESFKLRRHRHQFSDPDGVDRTCSLLGGSGGNLNARASTSSRAPLVSSQRHSRQSSYSDTGSLRVSGVSRRDSDRSRGSSRSRPSHHRQSSSASQQSRYESLHSRQNHGGSDSVYSTLTRDGHRTQLSVHSGPNGVAGGESTVQSRFVRGQQGVTAGGGSSVHLVFDSDEEAVPPYSESDVNTGRSSNTGDESDVENSEPSVSQSLDNTICTLFGTSHLPLNIPVTEVGTTHRDRPSNVRSGLTAGAVGTSYHSFGQPLHSSASEGLAHFQQPCLDQGMVVENTPILSGNINRVSPEICALTGERETPSTLRGSPSPLESSTSTLQPSSGPSSSTPRISTGVASSQVSHLNHSSDSSDTSLPEHERSRVHSEAAAARSASSDLHSLVSVPGRRGAEDSDDTLRSRSSSGDSEAAAVTILHASKAGAMSLSLGSPNSAFRPVGRTVPVAQMSPSELVSVDRLFMPISSPAAVPNNNLESSSESLSRSSALSWKSIPLPSAHNHSNRASSVPTKELSSKNIPVYEFHSPNVFGQARNSNSFSERNAGVGGSSTGDIVTGLVSPRYRGQFSATRGASSATEGLDVSNTAQSSQDSMQAQGVSEASHGASSLQFSTLPLRGQASEPQRSSRNSIHSSAPDSSQRHPSRDSRQRHTVELPPSVRTQPQMGVSASRVSPRGRAERDGSDRGGSSVQSAQAAERDGAERRSVPLMLSPRSIGQSLRISCLTRPSGGGQVGPSASYMHRSHSRPLSGQFASRSVPAQQPLGLRQQRSQLIQQPAQVQRQQQPHNQRAGQQQQQQQQQQQAGQQNRPLFSLLL